ncbi:MAG: hypothetical protein METHP_01280 [Methanoregula sp. SKADARSKE-2]|nr:MAG: hypothetical protein METHP_01280 [Methanoregula sp. SKADARSKE-2]
MPQVSPVTEIYRYAVVLNQSQKYFELKVYEGWPYGLEVQNRVANDSDIGKDAFNEMTTFFNRTLKGTENKPDFFRQPERSLRSRKRIRHPIPERFLNFRISHRISGHLLWGFRERCYTCTEIRLSSTNQSGRSPTDSRDPQRKFSTGRFRETDPFRTDF